jgi:hypothetical protein
MTAGVPSQIDLVEYRLRLSRPLRPVEAVELRGFFGQHFPGEELLHHHRAEGGFRYQYPQVQFKVLDRTAHLIGIGAGAALVSRLWLEVDRTRIGLEELTVQEATLVRRRESVGESPEPVVYRFRSPWMALNQANYRRYEEAPDEVARRWLLERILLGNCLSLAKAVGHRVAARLTVHADLRPSSATIKGVGMRGFIGTFAVNFFLPQHLGIGKCVARGFGTVERVRQRTIAKEGPC